MLKFPCRKTITLPSAGKNDTITVYKSTNWTPPGPANRQERYSTGYSALAKKYRPTMHPKCAAALEDKDGKNLLMLKGRTEVTTYAKVGGFHSENETAEMRSLIFLSKLLNIIHVKYNPPAIHLTCIHHKKSLMRNLCFISPWNNNAILIFRLAPHRFNHTFCLLFFHSFS